jgi:acetylornithine/N-succinyldiaminopimelate aminotransferase
MANHLVNAYSQLPVHFERGEGAWLFDAEGKKYLDAYSGIAVTGLGHNHPAVTKAIQEQASKVIHTSNLVTIPQQIELSNILAELADMDSKVFFNNSGAEAVETALKLARLYGHSKNIEDPKVIVMEGSFHGRTLATIFAGSSAKAQAGFGPPVAGFVRVKYNDASAIETAIKNDRSIVAVLIEPIQGESGINVPPIQYLKDVRDICTKNNVLLLADEVQSGMGRTGKFFCFEHSNIKPDAIMMAKGLANGVPIGACIIREPYYDLFKPGSHGSTFGGNPLACVAAIATVQAIKKDKLLENAATQGKKLIDGLKKVFTGNKHVVEVRGQGLMIGVQLDRECRDILPIALKHGIIFNIANLNTLRIMPPLIIDAAQTQQIIDTIPILVQEFNT